MMQTVEDCAKGGVVCIQGQTCAPEHVELAVLDASVCLQELLATEKCVAGVTLT